MKILFIGDVVGKMGRKAIQRLLPSLQKTYRPDVVIANAENSAHGAGITSGVLQELLDAGVDFCTSGDHVWDKKEVLTLFQTKGAPLIRPANFPGDVPGDGVRILSVKQQKLLVINLLGQVFMKKDYDNPFHAFDDIMKKYNEKSRATVLVDFHAEATSEKVAFSLYVNGRASVVLGTHTHVPTADARIIGGQTAAITDVGMTGYADGVIGVHKDGILRQFLTQMPTEFTMVDAGRAVLNAVFVEIEKRKPIKIEHIHRETAIS